MAARLKGPPRGGATAVDFAMGPSEQWRQWARRLKSEVLALYYASRYPRVPWYAKVVAACVVAYAFSPIDLIPDPIPSWATWTTS